MKTSTFLIALGGMAAGFVLGSMSTLPRPDGIPPPPSLDKAMDVTPAADNSPRLAEAKRILTGTGGLRDLAELSRSIAGFDANEMAKLLDWLEASRFGQPQERMATIFASWLKRDPAAAKAWLHTRIELAAQDAVVGESPRTDLIRTWARLFPQEALAFAAEHSRSDLARQLVTTVFWHWPADDEAGMLAEMRRVYAELPTGLARKALTEKLFSSWGSSSPVEALASADGLGNAVERSRALRFVFEMWPTEQAERAITEYQRLGIEDAKILEKLFERLADSDWSRGIALSKELGPGALSEIGTSIAGAWAKVDPTSALTWAVAHGVPLIKSSDLRHVVGHGSISMSGGTSVNAMNNAMTADAAAVTRWIASLPDGAQRCEMASMALVLAEDREDALKIYELLPEGARSWGAAEVARRLATEPEQGMAWCAALPAGSIRANAWQALGGGLPMVPAGIGGSDRDAFLIGHISNAPVSTSFSGGTRHDVTRWNLIMEIQDPILRRDVFESVVGSALGGDNSSESRQARDWLEGTNVPDEWKRKWQ